MAAEFRSVQTRMWREDEWFQGLEIDARLLFIYLFTNPSASIAGIYRLPIRTMAFESGIPVERVGKLLDEFSAAGKAHYADGVIWVVRMRENQLPGKINEQLQAKLRKDIAAIPDCPLKAAYLAHYGVTNRVQIPYQYPIDTSRYVTDTDTDTDTETVTEPIPNETEPAHSPTGTPTAAQDKDATKAVARCLEDHGVALTPYLIDEYMGAVKDYGIHATLAGIQAAAEQGKQQKLKYVLRCIENKASGDSRTNGNGNHAPPKAIDISAMISPELAKAIGA